MVGSRKLLPQPAEAELLLSGEQIDVIPVFDIRYAAAVLPDTPGCQCQEGRPEAPHENRALKRSGAAVDRADQPLFPARRLETAHL